MLFAINLFNIIVPIVYMSLRNKNLEDVKTIINYSYGLNKLIHLDLMEFNPLLGDLNASLNTIKEIFE